MAKKMYSSPDDFVGRSADLAALRRLLDGGTRLVTIVGAGGVGKTRLASEFGGSLGARRFGFADLSHCHSAPQVIQCVAGSLGLRLQVEDDAAGAEAVRRALSQRRSLVLVLDNVEQVAAAVASLLSVWLGEPGPRFIATSRQRLGLRHEKTLELRGLGVPEARATRPAEVLEAPAVKLFCRRAQLVSPEFRLANETAAVTAEIARRLDGIPLALELAAARVRILTLPQLLTRLDRQLELLNRGADDAHPRHATMRASVAWSWDLLDPAERKLLSVCSIFRGGFDLAAVEAVTAHQTPDGLVMDLLHALVEASLLKTRESSASPRQRYTMLVSVREFAASQLDDNTSRAARLAHRHYYAAQGTLLNDRVVRLDADAAHLVLRQEHHNLLTAWNNSLEAEDAKNTLLLALALDHQLTERAPAQERVSMLETSLTVATVGPAETAVLRAQVETCRAAAFCVMAQTHRALEILDGVCTTLSDASKTSAWAWAVSVISGAYTYKGQRQRALDEMQRAAELHHPLRHDAPARDAMIQSELGARLSDLGRASEALPITEAALEHAKRSGCGTRVLALLQCGYGADLVHLGRNDDAARVLAESLANAQASDAPATARAACEFLGHLNYLREHFAEAIAFYQAGLEMAERLGDPHLELNHSNMLVWSQICGDHDTAALAAQDRQYRVGHRTAFSVLHCWQRMYHVILDWRSGRLGPATAASEHLEEYARQPFPPEYRPLLLSIRAALLTLCEHGDEAGPLFAESGSLLKEVEPDPLTKTAEVFCAFERLEDLKSTPGSPECHPNRGREVFELITSVFRGDYVQSTRLRRWWPRIAAQLLVKALPDRLQLAFRAHLTRADDTSLLVDLESGQLRPPGHDWIDLAMKPTLLRLIAGLVELRRQSPHRSLKTLDLWKIGWPGDNINADSATNRVYYHLTTLRKLGFRDILMSDEDGYRLDPAVPMVRLDS